MLWWPLPSTNFVPPHFSAAGWQDIDPKLYDVSVISMRNVSSRVQMNCMSWDAHKLLLGCRQSSKALALVISCQRNSPQKTSTPWNMQHMVFTPLLTCGTWCSPHCSLAAHGVHPTAHLQHMVFTPLLICGTWCSHHCSLAAHGVHPTAHFHVCWHAGASSCCSAHHGHPALPVQGTPHCPCTLMPLSSTLYICYYIPVTMVFGLDLKWFLVWILFGWVIKPKQGYLGTLQPRHIIIKSMCLNCTCL